MPTSCKICAHDDRAEIENAILNLTSDAPPNRGNSIEKIAEDFKLDLTELKAHAMFHTPLSGDSIQGYTSALDSLDFGESEQFGAESDSSDSSAALAESSTPRELRERAQEQRASLTRKMKLREADMLDAVNNEYLVTLKTMGRRINKLAQTSSIDLEEMDQQVKVARLLTKPMVDLYVGLGGEIRQNVKTMAELDRLLNGPEDSGNSGLAALAAAIAMSSNKEDGFPRPAGE